MQVSRREAAKIAKYRAGVEARLSTLLKEVGSSVTTDDYKQAIFNGPDVSHFRAYLKEALELFDCSDIDSASDAVIAVIEDAWNYFPHKSLNGRCPAEIAEASSSVQYRRMTRLLEQAVAEVGELPEDVQDAVAAVIFSYLSNKNAIDPTQDR